MTFKTKPPIEVRKQLGAHIRAARKRHGLSIDRAAVRLGTSRQQWIRWEKGDHVPGEFYAPRLAELLGLDPSVFPADGGDDEEAASMTAALADALRQIVAHELARQKEHA